VTAVEQYRRDFATYMSLPGAERCRLQMYPRLEDKTASTPLDAYYFRQDTWAFKRIVDLKPSSIVDVGSTALLVGILAQMFPTTSIDIRPIPVSLPGLTCRQGSITNLPFKDASVELLSSLCVIEHIGLGRYGDKLDPLGSIKACKEISRVLKPGGHFIMSTQVSHTPALCFNAHRIFTQAQVLDMLPAFSVTDEAFFFPRPGNAEDIEALTGFRFCFWCVDLVKESA